MLPLSLSSLLATLCTLHYFISHSCATFIQPARTPCVSSASEDSNVTTVSPCFQHQPLLTHLSPFTGHSVQSQWSRDGALFHRRPPGTNYLSEEENNRLFNGGYNYPYGYAGPQPEDGGGQQRTLFMPPRRSWNPFFWRPPPPPPSWLPWSRPTPSQYPSSQYPPSYQYARPGNFLSGLFSKRTNQVYPPSVTEEKTDPVYLGPGTVRLVDHRIAELTCSFNDQRIVSNVDWVKVVGPYEWQSPVPPFNCARPECTYQEIHARENYQLINLGYTSVLRIHMYSPSDLGVYRCAATAQLPTGKIATVYRMTEFNFPTSQ